MYAVGISCFITEGHALLYYGAKIVPTDWEICVPDDCFERASAISTSELYEPWIKIPPQLRSLKHTYPRFTLKGVNFFFSIVPAFEYFVKWKPANLERSKMNIPFPKLKLLAQSLLDTQRQLDLTNLVYGMDLSEEWGEDHLDLDKPGELEYAKEKNEKLIKLCGETLGIVLRLRETPMDLRQQWQKIVRGKWRRINIEQPQDLYNTRFRMKGSGDPRLRERQNI
ncbi:hypothetical protein F4819DRAFT_503173 [Hypoxylon fuscum]|nr:hypothetical protein F4819DRAFT_503173 [Hypoxylon fuscum]